MADSEEYLNEDISFMQPLKLLSWDINSKNDTAADIQHSYTFTSNSSTVDCTFVNISNSIALKNECYLTATSTITSAFKCTAPIVRATAIKCKSSVYGNTYTNENDNYATTIQHGTAGDMNLYAASKVTLETDNYVESMSKAGLVVMNVANSLVTSLSAAYAIATNPNVSTGLVAGGAALINSILPALGGVAMNTDIADTVAIDTPGRLSFGIQSKKIVFNDTNELNIEASTGHATGSLKFKSNAINMVADTINAFIGDNAQADENKLHANAGGNNSITITDNSIKILGQGNRGKLEITGSKVEFSNAGSSVVIDNSCVKISSGASVITIKSDEVNIGNLNVDANRVDH